MKFAILIIGVIYCLSAFAYGIPAVYESPLEAPHLKVEHVVSTPICSLGSNAPDLAKCSTITIVLKGAGDPTPLDVVFAIDFSNTMNTSDPTNERLNATKEFIKILNNSIDRAGLVYWNDTIINSRLMNLTNEFEELIKKLDEDIIGEGILPEGTTNFDKALNASIDMFEKGQDKRKIIIFLSDGNPYPLPYAYTPPNNKSSPVNRARDAGIEIWTVGFYHDPLSINGSHKATLVEIADITRGKYNSSYNLTVGGVFQEIYNQIVSLAGKNITVEYHAPKDLIYSIGDRWIEGDNKVFVWTPEEIGDIYIGKSWTEKFNVASNIVGNFTLGNAPGSFVNYTKHDEKQEDLPIGDRILEVIDCDNESCNQIEILLNFSITNITLDGSIDIHIEGGNYSFGPFYCNCTPSPGPDGESSQKVVCVCMHATCPECTTVAADKGSKVNNINIVQTAIFGATPYWNGTDELAGVINLTVSRPEAAIDAVLAFDVSGSMRHLYEGMSEEEISAFAEANFSNVSIIGWDEYGVDGDGSGADHLMVPPRLLRESREDVLAAMASLSGLCDETDQTIYAAGLQGVLEVDGDFGDHLGGDGKVVLFITGPEEFRPGEGLGGLATDLKRRGYAIYAVGVDIDEIDAPLKCDNLSMLSNMTGGRFYPIDGLTSEILRDVLQDAVAHASARVAPRDIVVTETLPTHLEVKETVPAGVGLDLAKNPDGTTTFTWTAGGVRPGESRSLILLTAVNGELRPDGVGTIAVGGGINITATCGDAAGINVINLRTENGDVKIGEIS